MTQNTTTTAKIDRAAVDAAWANWTPPTKFERFCSSYFNSLPMRGMGGLLTDNDKDFLVKAAKHYKCRISEVVDKLRASDSTLEKRVGDRLVEWDIYGAPVVL